MTGSVAERNLLGAVISDSKAYRTVKEMVSADDFEDGRLGAIFAGVGRMIVAGDTVNAISVQNRFADWRITGIHPAEVFEWTGSSLYSFAAPEYGAAVRDAAVRRGLEAVARLTMEAANDAGTPAPDTVAKAIQLLEQIRAGAASAQFIAKRLAEILEGEDEYDWIIPGLLERKDRLIMTGAEGAGKTTFVRQLAVLSAAGIHPMSFQRIDPVKVLVVDAENTEKQWRRATRETVRLAQQHGTTDPAQTVHLMAGTRIDITKEAHLGEIHRLIDLHKPDVLFIGPLYKLVPKAINNDDDATPLIVALDSLRERDIALVMEAHAGKATGGDGERDLRPRGSSALLGWPEFGFGMRPIAEDPDMVSVVRWRGDRDERAWPRHMRRNGLWPWTPVNEGPR